MESIYTQAIADAKAVRESAIANAKATIHEAFEPKIKAMLRKSIVESEMDEMEEGEHIVHTKKSSRSHEAGYAPAKAPKGAIEDLEEEYDEMEESEEDEMDEAKHIVHTKKSSRSHEAGYMPAPAPKGAIEDLEEEMDEMDEMHHEEEMDEASLDEILDELSSMDEDGEEDQEEDELDESYEMDEAKEEDEEEEEDGQEPEEETKVVDITLGDLVDAIKSAMAGTHAEPDGDEAPEMSDDSEVSLDEILAELEEECEEEEMDKAKKTKVAGTKGAAVKASEKETDYKIKAEELEEAKKAIKKMQKELNEVNLLNAKLLYVNKIFKTKSLTESQKVKVLNAFDRATTVKEVKNVYATLNEAVVATPKAQLKESYGFASKPAGNAPKINTVESDSFIARMQKLAGL